jgi:hemerythrin-like metal-binding protein
VIGLGKVDARFSAVPAHVQQATTREGAMIEWNSDYLTGIDEIDLQHQYFAKLINRIEAKIASIALDEGHSPLLTELAYYTRFHFLSEENIMREAGYPALSEHMRLHSDLIQRLNNEIHMLESELVEPAHIVGMLSDWFHEHTLVEDGKFAAFAGRDAHPAGVPH